MPLLQRITDEDVYRRRWQLLALTSVGAFMWPLDGSIVSVAMPVMGADLGLSFAAAMWVSAAFLLTTAVLHATGAAAGLGLRRYLAHQSDWLLAAAGGLLGGAGLVMAASL